MTQLQMLGSCQETCNQMVAYQFDSERYKMANCKIADFSDRHNLLTTRALSTTILDKQTKNSRLQKKHTWRSLIHLIQIGYWLVTMGSMALRQQIISRCKMKLQLQLQKRHRHPAFPDGLQYKQRMTMSRESHLGAPFRAPRLLWQV